MLKTNLKFFEISITQREIKTNYFKFTTNSRCTRLRLTNICWQRYNIHSSVISNSLSIQFDNLFTQRGKAKERVKCNAPKSCGKKGVCVEKLGERCWLLTIGKVTINITNVRQWEICIIIILGEKGPKWISEYQLKITSAFTPFSHSLTSCLISALCKLSWTHSLCRPSELSWAMMLNKSG